MNDYCQSEHGTKFEFKTGDDLHDEDDDDDMFKSEDDFNFDETDFSSILDEEETTLE